MIIVPAWGRPPVLDLVVRFVAGVPPNSYYVKRIIIIIDIIIIIISIIIIIIINLMSNELILCRGLDVEFTKKIRYTYNILCQTK